MKVDISEAAFATGARLLGNLAADLPPVQQQQVIEVMMAGHAMRMSGWAGGVTVIDGMAKHAKQLMEAMGKRV